MQEHLLRIKKRYDAPIILITLVLSLPLAWLLSLVSSSGGMIVIVLAFCLGFLLQSGTPPLYALILMFITTVRPVGIPALMITVDESGRVSLLTPTDAEGGIWLA